MSDENLKKDKKPKKKNVSRYYVSNDKLIEELEIIYRTGVFTQKMGEYVNQIVEGIGKSSNFLNYSYLCDMKSDAIYRVCKAITDKGFKIIPDDQIGKWKKDKEGKQVYTKTHVDEDGNPVYDMNSPVKVTQNNAFGYFSMIAWHAFQNRIKTEKKHETAVESYRDKVFEDFELEHGIKTDMQTDDENY